MNAGVREGVLLIQLCQVLQIASSLLEEGPESEAIHGDDSSIIARHTHGTADYNVHVWLTVLTGDIVQVPYVLSKHYTQIHSCSITTLVFRQLDIWLLFLFSSLEKHSIYSLIAASFKANY